jgi:poly [ADP-ribose] polymerase
MTKLNDSQWEAQWGRVKGDLTKINQSEGQRKVYSMYDWDKTYREKTKKGYSDVTHFYEVIDVSTNLVNGVQTQDPTSVIKNQTVKQLMIDLQKYASISVKANYTISSDSVTQIMVDEAQLKLDTIKSFIKINGNVQSINSELIEFYKIIPRKMEHVRNYLIDSLKTDSDLEKVQKMIGNEQDTLDVMAGQVKLKAQQKELDAKNKQKEIDASTNIPSTEPVSLLDQMGLEVEPATSKEIEEVKKLAGGDASKVKKVFKVVNKSTFKKYQTVKQVDEHLFWHGSRNQNWFNILQTGLLIRPSGAIHTGSMFGDGIYFANKAAKSLGYSSFRGSYWAGGSDNKAYLALFKVNVGKQKHITRHTHDCYSLSQSKLSREGFDSVYAHGGADLRNDEFIIYTPERCTVAYLVEIG